MNQHQILRTALAGLFAVGMSTAALAQTPKGMEQCFGIAKAGKNDCGSNKTAHSCAGQSKKDYDVNDFKAVKTGTCVQMGGSLTQGQPGKLAMEKKS